MYNSNPCYQLLSLLLHNHILPILEAVQQTTFIYTVSMY